MVFDGQGVLATAKATSLILIFTCGHVVCPENTQQNSINKNKEEEEDKVRDDRISPGDNDVTSGGSSTGSDTAMQEEEADVDTDIRNESLPSAQQNVSLETMHPQIVPPPPIQTKIFFALLFGTVATCRAALNIASAKFTLSYYITAINSLTPLVVSIGDKVLLKTDLPTAIWPCIFASIVGCVTIAASQSPLIPKDDNSEDKFSFTSQDVIGCGLQFISMCFSATARLLMKRTEHILSRNEAVQTNNACNFIFPLSYTLVTNPGGWQAYRKMSSQSVVAWTIISVLVYTIGSTGQMSLVRSMGPGMYSSLGATRVLGSAILSAMWLSEPVQNWLEWIGLLIIMCTMTLYTLASVDVRNSWRHLFRARDKVENDEGSDNADESVFAVVQLVPLTGEVDVDPSETRELL